MICNQVIHHCSDWREKVRLFSKAVKPGGFMWVNWLSIGCSWGHYILKNQITFFFGRTPEGRLKLGKFLFGWWDRRYNTQNVEENSFFADRYAAYYKIIFLGDMKRELEKNGFSIISTHPHVDVIELMRQNPDKERIIGKLAQSSQVARFGLNLSLRTIQFMKGGGGMRGFFCVKS